MKGKQCLRIIIGISIITACQFAQAQCPPKSYSKDSMAALKQKAWRVEDQGQRQQLALNLLPCLANPNPALRDEFAFEALSTWMRDQQLDRNTLQQIRLRLLGELQRPFAEKNDEFLLPFAALTLAEISRVDQLKPFLSDSERRDMVDAAAKFLSRVNDYRGYDEKAGWRHGVAHGADWMLQLSLNKALMPSHYPILLAALAKQISNSKHFYIYGEAERLMAPILYMGVNSPLTQEEWDAWFTDLLKTDLDLSKTSQANLARHHNLKAFFTALYVQVQESDQVELRNKFTNSILKSLKSLN